MSKRNTFDRNTVPEDFTLALVLVDAIPVLFFGASTVVLSLLFGSRLFLLGALLCLFAGACKVFWKLIVVWKRKNIWLLFIQMRRVMPLGFLLMLLSVFLNRESVSFAGIRSGFLSFPSVIFFGIGILGMILMGIFGAVLDSGDVKANWIEQCTNGLAQTSIFVGLLLLI